MPHKGRFFARITYLDLTCPNCGLIYSSRKSGKSYNKKTGFLKAGSSWWDPLTCRFNCLGCKKVYQLGVLAYRIKSFQGRQLAMDQVPTPQEIEELKTVKQLRDESFVGTSGFVAEGTLDPNKDHANKVIEGVDVEGNWIE